MMTSTITQKSEKAILYAGEPDRLRISGLLASFEGGADVYAITLADGVWRCACDFFARHGVCCHIDAVGRMLERSLPAGVARHVSELAA